MQYFQKYLNDKITIEIESNFFCGGTQAILLSFSIRALNVIRNLIFIEAILECIAVKCRRLLRPSEDLKYFLDVKNMVFLVSEHVWNNHSTLSACKWAPSFLHFSLFSDPFIAPKNQSH